MVLGLYVVASTVFNSG